MTAVSVGAELAVLHRAVEGIGEALSSPDVEGRSRALHQLASSLDLVAARLALLRRAVVGAEDPAVLLAPFNVVEDEPGPDDDPDVLLHPKPPQGARTGRRR